jgi:hypothetical protein
MTEGGCICGAIRYRVKGEPRRVTHCHCLHCRRASGAPIVTWAEFDAEGFSFTRGTPREYASRPLVTRQFCGECGTQLTYRHAEVPEALDVTVASFDDPDSVEPEDHIWSDRELHWLRMRDGLPRFRRSRHDGGD